MSTSSQSTVTDSTAAVPLPGRDSSLKGRKPPVWPIDASETTQPTPLPAKCARDSRENGVCCKELKSEERHLIDPDVVRDVIIGLSDGLTVPFALTAGLSSLGESNLVVLGGIAELIAGAISMGIGGFLASQAERDHYRYLRTQTASRVVRSCAGEMEREVSEVLGPIGVDETTCRAVAKSLRDVEVDGYEGGGSSSADEESVSLRWSKDVGLTAFLLKFGEGLEEVPTKRLYISAFTIGMGYLLGGLIPLLPYFFFARAATGLIYSCIVTGIVLLIFGAVKARVTGAGTGALSILWGAISTLLVGGIAAGAAFGIVKALEGESG
ncbi:membrane fraction protein [Armillaria solidipes]|uniref:Membrane fraction protein n=1 Tax=Armillaria solidipes TaxID=1076256 RepID=A0A2H3B850_9AGAR|nr:membrane fraction protein [Armillaria solidipes]